MTMAVAATTTMEYTMSISEKDCIHVRCEHDKVLYAREAAI